MVLQVKTEAEFYSELTKNKVTFVDFFATWCGPCRMIAPKLEEFTKETGVHTIKVDVDILADLAGKYNITAMPTFKVLDSTGTEVGSLTGANPPKVKELYLKAKALL